MTLKALDAIGRHIAPAEPKQLQRRYCRVSDVVRITGVSRSQVFRALNAGELRGYQPAGSRIWLIEMEAVDAWIKGGRAA